MRVAAYNTARGRPWMFGRGCVQQGGESVAAEGEDSLAAAEGRNGGRGERRGGGGKERERGERRGGRCARRVGECGRVRVSRGGRVKNDRALEFWAARAAVSACEIGPKNFGPVYFQKAKLQIFLHFGPKFRELNKALVCGDPNLNGGQVSLSCGPRNQCLTRQPADATCLDNNDQR